jgi:putative heme transporter
VRSRRVPADGLPSWITVGGAAAWRLLAMAGLVWLLVQLVIRVRIVVVPLGIALALAALLAPLKGFLARRRVPGGLASLIPVVLLVGFGTATVALFVHGLSQQWESLAEAIEEGWHQLAGWIRRLPINVSPSSWVETAEAQLRDQAGAVARSAMGTVWTAVEIVMGVGFALVFTFFLLRDGERMFEGMLRPFSEEHRALARAAGQRSWRTLQRFLIGLTIVSAVNTVLTGIALLILEIPQVVPLVMLTFVLCYVPYLGTLLANAAAVLVALADRGPMIALIMAAAGITIELIESNVTQPLVQGRVLHIPPLVVLTVVTAGGVLAGISGAFLAVPVVMTLYAAIRSVSAGDTEERDEAPEGASRAQGELEHAPAGG